MALNIPGIPNFNVQVPDILGEQQKQATLSGMLSENALRKQLAPLQVQEQQQKVQAGEMQNELQRIALNDSRIFADYLKTGDAGQETPSDFSMRDKIAAFTGIDKNDPIMGPLSGLANKGYSGQGLLVKAQELLQKRTEYNKGTEELQTIQKNERLVWQEAFAELHELPEDQRSVALAAKLPLLEENSKSDPILAAYANGLKGHPELIDQAYNVLSTENAALGLREKKAKAKEAEQKVIPEGGGLSPEKQQEVAKDVAVAKATQPLKVQLAREEAQARQQAAQGDPSVAGKMLAEGSLTIADLKTRGTTPQFIEQATLAAQKRNPTYNPADEVIAEHVAKSPQANQFFGSANSLIAKGGTLDQLEAQGKKIPGNQLPVLNTVEDWMKLASGKGPLAGYAATALGVADDYGKVMGGGNASDHARDAALQLFAKAQSPEQRADAIKATRAAVQSQRDSRIGNNQFLKRQYGAEVSAGGAFNVPAGAPAAPKEDGHKLKQGDKVIAISQGGQWVSPNSQ